MENATMGKVIVAAKVENLFDLEKVYEGSLPANQVRHVEIADALVDSGSTGLLLPKRYIEQLGLRHVGEEHNRVVNGKTTLRKFSAVRLTVQERDCVIDVKEVSDDTPVLIGQMPLEAMDWVIDMKNQRLIGNPDHDGKWMSDAF